MKVISICGLPGSGKSTAIDAIKDIGHVITMGDVIRQEARLRNIPGTGENLGKIARELRERHGPEIIAKKCVDMIKSLGEEIIIVDGVRSLSEVTIFRTYWSFPIIAIIASEEIRFKRLLERERSDDPKTIEDLRKRDNREIEFGQKWVIEAADYKIYNDSTIEELKKKTRTLVLDILGKE